MTKKWFLSLALLMTAAAYADLGITGSTSSAARIIDDALTPEDINMISECPDDCVYIPCNVRECLDDIDCSAFEAGSPLTSLVSACKRGMSVNPGSLTKSAINKAIAYYDNTPGTESASYADALAAYKKELEAGQASFTVKAPAGDAPEVRGKDKAVCPPPALKKDVVTGSALFIKGKGAICGDLKVGCNLSVGGGVSFNHRGCTKLRAKGALEKNLLNVRGVFAFDCNPCLSLSINNDCAQSTTASVGPRINCLDQYLSANLGNPAVKLRCGFGIAPECATVKASGTACASNQFNAPAVGTDSSVIATLNEVVTIEVCVPLCFCVPFCDCPALVASYEDRSVCPRSICVGTPTEWLITDQPCVAANPLFGGSTKDLITFLGTSVSFQHSSRTNVWLKITLTYAHCAKYCGTASTVDGTTILIDNNQLCSSQQNAVQAIGNDANQRLQCLWAHVIAEGRVL